MSQQNPYCHSPFRSAQFAPQTSAFAVLSMLSGLLAVPLICMCFISVPFSIAAIIFGHSARGSVRHAAGRYEGFGMATFGMLLGYVTLAIVAAIATVPIAAHSIRASRSTGENQASVLNPLLNQAEDQLLADTERQTSGVTTTDVSAVDLARHYIEALQILDQTQIDEGLETEIGAISTLEPYRVFVQLNPDSAAFLLYVPAYDRFTDEQKRTLHSNAWLIAQRSVDDYLAKDSRLALGVYSQNRRETVMIGRTSSETSTVPQPRQGDAKTLASVFRLANRLVDPDSAGAAETNALRTIPIEGKPKIMLPEELETKSADVGQH